MYVYMYACIYVYPPPCPPRARSGVVADVLVVKSSLNNCSLVYLLPIGYCFLVIKGQPLSGPLI